MSLVEIDWRPGRRKLREFAYLLAAVLVLVAAGIAVKARAWQAPDAAALRVPLLLAAAGAALAAAGAAVPGALRPLYLVWMGVSFPIGLVTTNLLVAAMFYGIFTPLGLLMRWSRRDALRLRRPGTGSCWVERPPAPPPKRYFHQY